MVEKTSFHDNNNNSVVVGSLLFSQGRENDFFWPFIATVVFGILYVAKKGLFNNKKKLNLSFACGRGKRIRTSDLCVPNAALYLTELHPEPSTFPLVNE